jgi:hypothetical protein
MSTATAPAIDIVTELKSAFAEYQTVERRGLDFGRRLYELRAGAEVVQGGTSFTASLDAASIPRRTAYYWIHSYELSIGERKPRTIKPAVIASSDYDRGFSDGHAEALHKVAAVRFKADSSKCYQRHIGEVYAEIDGRQQMTSLPRNAQVVAVTNEEAASLIHKYEWLQTMGAGTIACYGLKIEGELLGVACFGKGGSTEARDIIEDREAQTICLMRGACVPWAPKNAGSFLVRHACRLASKDRGWTVFFAYSDPDAGEMGTIYQACGWEYIGTPKAGKHVSFTKDGETVSSYQFNRKSDAFFQSLGWDGVQGKYEFLRANGWTEVQSLPKRKYVWIENERNRAELLSQNDWEPLPYPKRDECSLAGGAA